MILKYFVVSPFSESATSKCGVVDSCSLLQMNKAMQPRSALTARRAPCAASDATAADLQCCRAGPAIHQGGESGELKGGALEGGNPLYADFGIL